MKQVPFDLSIDWESAKGLAAFQYTKPNEDDDNEIETVVMVRAPDNVEDLEPNLTNESLEIVNEGGLIHCWAFVLATSDRWNEKANLAARSVVVRFIKAQSIGDELNWLRENCIAAEALVGNKIYIEANALQIMEKVEVVCQTIEEKKNGTVVDKKQLMAEFSKMNSLSGSERQTTVGAKKKEDKLHSPKVAGMVIGIRAVLKQYPRIKFCSRLMIHRHSKSLIFHSLYPFHQLCLAPQPSMIPEIMYSWSCAIRRGHIKDPASVSTVALSGKPGTKTPEGIGMLLLEHARLLIMQHLCEKFEKLMHRELKHRIASFDQYDAANPSDFQIAAAKARGEHLAADFSWLGDRDIGSGDKMLWQFAGDIWDWVHNRAIRQALCQNITNLNNAQLMIAQSPDLSSQVERIEREYRTTRPLVSAPVQPVPPPHDGVKHEDGATIEDAETTPDAAFAREDMEKVQMMAELQAKAQRESSKTHSMVNLEGEVEACKVHEKVRSSGHCAFSGKVGKQFRGLVVNCPAAREGQHRPWASSCKWHPRHKAFITAAFLISTENDFVVIKDGRELSVRYGIQLFLKEQVGEAQYARIKQIVTSYTAESIQCRTRAVGPFSNDPIEMAFVVPPSVLKNFKQLAKRAKIEEIHRTTLIPNIRMPLPCQLPQITPELKNKYWALSWTKGKTRMWTHCWLASRN